MTVLHHEVSIDAPLAKVWAAVSDLLAVQHYNPTVASVRCISPRAEGVGAARRCDLKPKGWVEERVWEWQPSTSIGLEVAASDWPIVFMKWRTELSPAGSGTLVRQEMSYQLKFGPLGSLLDALVMKRKLDRQISDIFTSLKRYTEAR